MTTMISYDIANATNVCNLDTIEGVTKVAFKI